MSAPLTLRTRICDLFGIEYPILLAGMGPVALPELVAAVSNAGGLGVLGRSTPYMRPLHPEELRARIRRVRELTDKPFGIDLILPSGMPETGEGVSAAVPKEHREFVEKLRIELGIPEPTPDEVPFPVTSIEYARSAVRVICEEKVPVFASGLGLPEWVVPILREAGIKVIGIVGNVRNARRIAALHPDVIVAQGYDAGGHTGRVGTFSLVPQVVDAVQPLPVLAAGGVADGRGVAAALALGADGVWCGTAFLATRESPIHPLWRQRILEMSDDDTRISKSVTGKTVRFIRNRWIEEWERSGVAPLPFPYQTDLVIDVLRMAIATGNPDALPMPTGQIGGMIKEVKPAGEVLRAMVADAVAILASRRGVIDQVAPA